MKYCRLSWNKKRGTGRGRGKDGGRAVEGEGRVAKVEWQRIEAERLQMFEYMRGVYTTIGQPPPPMPVPTPQPAPNTVSGTVSHFITL